MCHCGLSDHKLIQQFVSPRNAVLQKETTANSRQTQSAICSWSDPHVKFTHVAWLSPQNSANAITQNELNTPFKKSLMLRYSSNSLETIKPLIHPADWALLFSVHWQLAPGQSCKPPGPNQSPALIPQGPRLLEQLHSLQSRPPTS